MGQRSECIKHSCEVEIKGTSGPPVRIEEDIDEGGSNGRQRLGVQGEDTEAVLRALNGMHGGTGPCWGYMGHKVERQSWAGVTPGGWAGKGLGESSRSHTLRDGVCWSY